MNRRNNYSKRRRSSSEKLGYWLGALVSLIFPLGLGIAVRADVGSFRSCSVNNSGLFIDNCGKQSLSPGDLLLVALFFASIALSFALMTHAWRITRGGA